MPSTDRVLNILGRGIADRSTTNGEVLRRFTDMKSRWRNLQERMTRVEREMTGVESLLKESDPTAEQSTPEKINGHHLDSSLLTPSPVKNSQGAKSANFLGRSVSPFRTLL